MPSTFFGLTIAGSGLSSFQAAINTTANNISNVQTDGYTKQVANRVASEALRVHQKYGTTGSGVTTTSITQVRDFYYDVKYWENNANVGYYDKRLYYMKQIETYYIDDEKTYQKGFSTILDTMFKDLDSLKGNAGDVNKRNEFIGASSNLTSYFTGISEELQSLQSSCNDEIKTIVAKVNATASKIATLNKQINQLELNGGYANELRDQRALLIDDLAQIVPVTVNEVPIKDSKYPDRVTGANWYTVSINGQDIVDGYDYRTIECRARDYKVNQTDIDGLYDLYWSDTGNSFNTTNASMNGQLRALFEMRDGNNEENFSGVLTKVDGNKVTFDQKLSITDMAGMNMDTEGIITIGNKNFHYNGFSYKTTVDSEGNETITSFTFNLEDVDAAVNLDDYVGKKAEIGTSIDSLGIPYYMNQMTAFVRSFASKFNRLEQTGVDLNGNDMRTFFVANITKEERAFADDNFEMKAGNYTYTSESDTYYWLTAANFGVAKECVKDPTRFSTITKDKYNELKGKDPTGDITQGEDAYDLAEELLKLQSDVKMYRNCGASDFLKCLYNDVSVDKQEASTFNENFANISESITSQRLSISGVDEDEEALDLVKFQNAYNLSSQMVQVMTEMYDQLILQTGV